MGWTNPKTIDEVIRELRRVRQEFDSLRAEYDQFKADLASTATGKGASMIGIADAGAKYSSSTVEGGMQELNVP